MDITFSQVLIWILIAALVGVVGNCSRARRHRRCDPGRVTRHFSDCGGFPLSEHEPSLDRAPLISSIIVAALLVAIWSSFAYRRVQPYTSRYYRQGSYARRPRSRRRWF